MKKILALMLLCLVPVLTACDEKSSAPPAETVTENPASTFEAWLGQWNGPEGTYLKLEKSGEGYGVTIKDLDKEERYLGVVSDNSIRFNRNNVEEHLTLVPGSESGMKWLTDKPYCLRVKIGEAYCRDKM